MPAPSDPWWKRLFGAGRDVEAAGDGAGAGLDGPATEPAGAPGALAGDHGFATALYAQLAAAPGNLLVSPASLRIALGMAYAGARAATATQMARTLGLASGDASHDELSAQLAGWAAEAAAFDAAPDAPEGPRDQVCLRVANRLWGQRGYAFLEPFLAELADRYGAPLGALDFQKAPELSRAAINRWVGEQTADKIKELLGPGTITAQTRLVLTSALYFLAAWRSPFAASRTRPGPFFTGGAEVEAPLMTQTATFPHAVIPGGQLLELAYGAGQYVMNIVLPDARDGAAELERAIGRGALAGWLGGLAPGRVAVTLPRFRFSTRLALQPALEALGMVDAFRASAADFSAIEPRRELSISHVVQQAMIDVTEQGTEAAAATAVVMTARGMMATPTVFRADHPFVFLIRDARSGAIVFLGRLVDPTG